MTAVAEIAGLFLVVVGLAAAVAAAAMVSTVLGVAAAGVLVTFGGVVTVYAANVADQRQKRSSQGKEFIR